MSASFSEIASLLTGSSPPKDSTRFSPTVFASRRSPTSTTSYAAGCVRRTKGEADQRAGMTVSSDRQTLTDTSKRIELDVVGDVLAVPFGDPSRDTGGPHR